MNKFEQNALLNIANHYAEKAYSETFLTLPDCSQEQTRQFLDSLTQAWLTGYNYLRKDLDLSHLILKKFGFYVYEEDL